MQPWAGGMGCRRLLCQVTSEIFPPSFVCYSLNGAFVAYPVFRIVSCFFPRTVSSEVAFQQMSVTPILRDSSTHSGRKAGSETAGADELISSLDGCLCPFPTQIRTAPLNTIKYWQLHSKLHL